MATALIVAVTKDGWFTFYEDTHQTDNNLLKLIHTHTMVLCKISIASGNPYCWCFRISHKFIPLRTYDKSSQSFSCISRKATFQRAKFLKAYFIAHTESIPWTYYDFPNERLCSRFQTKASLVPDLQLPSTAAWPQLLSYVTFDTTVILVQVERSFFDDILLATVAVATHVCTA